MMGGIIIMVLNISTHGGTITTTATTKRVGNNKLQASLASRLASGPFFFGGVDASTMIYSINWGRQVLSQPV